MLLASKPTVARVPPWREISTSWLGENSVRMPSLTSRSTFTDTDCSGWAENFSVLSG